MRNHRKFQVFLSEIKEEWKYLFDKFKLQIVKSKEYHSSLIIIRFGNNFLF